VYVMRETEGSPYTDPSVIRQDRADATSPIYRGGKSWAKFPVSGAGLEIARVWRVS
jgi:hypothetical protein